MKRATYKTIAASLAVALLLAAVAAGVWLAQAAGEQALVRTSHSRPLQAGELTPEGEAIPLVAALWEKGTYYDTRPLVWQDQYSSKESYAVMRRAALSGLAQAGVMPVEACETTIENAMDERSGKTLPDGIFTQLEDILVYDGTLVVSAYVDAVPGDDTVALEPALHAYVEYLGLDGLEDWQPAEIERPLGVGMVALYSPGAQVLVQVAFDGRVDGYQCGVYPLSREEYAQRDAGNG